jgi:hypothetical protein
VVTLQTMPVEAFTLQRRQGLGWDMHWKKMGANVTVFGFVQKIIRLG